MHKAKIKTLHSALFFFFQNALKLSKRAKKQCTVTALPIIKKL